MPDRSVAFIVHGHFYQPPRENPWTDSVDKEPGAEPYHDWNERIFHECYRANAYARVFDESGRVHRIVNNYEHLSYNVGPTLLSWLERHHTISYGRIIEADRKSARVRGGHGNAIAQGYNHTILPLCTPRDRRTQVRWGVADFRHRFRREPEGMWLPETAANHEVLDLLIDEGLRFTILSPYQALRVRRLGTEEWTDVTHGRLDPSRPYRYLHSDGSGRCLEIIFYDGPVARAIAFEGALRTSQGLLDTLGRGRGGGPMVNVATDGESYGHHFKFGDRTVAHALQILAPERDLWVTNYGELLDHHPPEHEVQLWLGEQGLGSSWSCAHGVGRWSADCGCHTGGRDGWTQAWRAPLRVALDFLRDECALLFEAHGGEYFEDPWAARDDYIQALLQDDPQLFLQRHARRALGERERVQALSLLQMQHHSMLMYTSCGWFFSDLAGIETTQILKYAGRTIDFMRELGHSAPFRAFLDRLGEARSNLPEEGNGADVYRRHVIPARVSPRRVTAHLAISGLVIEAEPEGEVAGYQYAYHQLEQRTHGNIQLITMQVDLTRASTGRSYLESAAALHLGGVDFYCVVRNDLSRQEFKAAAERLWGRFSTASVPVLLRLAAEEFGPKEYGLEHLLPGGAHHVARQIMGGLLQRFADQYAYLYEDHRRTLEMLQSAGIHLPKELSAAAEITLARRFEMEIAKQRESRDPDAYRRAIAIAEHASAHGFRLDPRVASRTFESMLAHSVQVAAAKPTKENLHAALELLRLIETLRLDVALERPQEALYAAITSRTDFPPDELNTLLRALWISPSILDAPP